MSHPEYAFASCVLGTCERLNIQPCFEIFSIREEYRAMLTEEMRRIEGVMEKAICAYFYQEISSSFDLIRWNGNLIQDYLKRIEDEQEYNYFMNATINRFREQQYITNFEPLPFVKTMNHVRKQFNGSVSSSTKKLKRSPKSFRPRVDLGDYDHKKFSIPSSLTIYTTNELPVKLSPSIPTPAPVSPPDMSLPTIPESKEEEHDRIPSPFSPHLTFEDSHKLLDLLYADLPCNYLSPYTPQFIDPFPLNQMDVPELSDLMV